MTTIGNGIIGGVAGAIVGMILVRLLYTETAITAIFISRDRMDDTPGWSAIVFPVLYGGLGGGTLVALDLYVTGILGVPPTVGKAFGVAVGWSAVLFAVLLILQRASHSQSESQAPLKPLLVFHLCYGLALGTWIRFTWIT